MRRRFPVVTLHVSVWVEMTICFKRPAPSACHAPRERVSWNGSEWLRRCWTACHAPRERVSWNMKYKAVASAVKVTLHVSVWVEMVYLTLKKSVLLSRSTWACELKWKICTQSFKTLCHAPRERVSWNSSISSNIFAMSVTLHVSVWVEIITFSYFNQSARRHAPRERVSWNRRYRPCKNRYAVTLHVSVWVEILCQTIYLKQEPCHAPRERVSWNIFTAPAGILALGHAPRERVSWNVLSHSSSNSLLVTLHVSVWVEISMLKC